MQVHGKAEGEGNFVMPYEGFREFMISLLGVSDSKEDILDAFALINKSDVAKREKLDFVLKPSDVAYFVRTAPPVEGGFSYKEWTTDIFSR